MRDEEFKQKLTEVSEWEIPLTMESTEQGRENRKRALEKEGGDCFNQTYPPKIKKVIHPQSPCEDCGKLLEGRKKEIQFYKNNGIRGRKEKCVNCGLHKDPYSGEFTLTGTEAAIKWASFCKSVKKRYKVSPKLIEDLVINNHSEKTSDC